jgi:NADPH:quinone reductase
MKALVYQNAHPIEQFAMAVAELPDPELRSTDILVEVKAIGVNPGEATFRATKSAEPGGRVLLGLEFSGVVKALGSSATGFNVGDRVYATGDMLRDGTWAEFVAIDPRLVARIPDNLSFADAASLPIGSLTAWEAMFREEDRLPESVESVLVVGGAGAVGSMAIQLLKARTPAKVIATASRGETQQWCVAMGADLVIDHAGDVPTQLKVPGSGPSTWCCRPEAPASISAGSRASCGRSGICRPRTSPASPIWARSSSNRSPSTWRSSSPRA